MKSWLIAFCLTSVVVSPALGRDLTATVFSTGDGDTFRIEEAGQRVTVRLACIDAPERKQAPYGTLAATRLGELLPVGSIVQLRVITRDRYGRTIAEAYHNGQLINLALVREGFAYVHPEYVHQCDRHQYTRAEAQAKQRRAGVWSQPETMPPWQYRRERRKS